MNRQAADLLPPGSGQPVAPGLPVPASLTSPAPPPGRKVFWLGLLLAVLPLLLFFRAAPPQGHAQNSVSSPALALFRGWDQPEVALVISGQMHGYLQPCGCSHPQYGGLARRLNFLQTLKNKNWPLVLVDLGELVPNRGPQAMLKYQTAMKALKVMNYTAIGVGKHEFSMPLIEALSHYSLENRAPAVLAANLLNRDNGQVFEGLVKSFEVSAASKYKVGVVGLVGPSVAATVKDPDAKFATDNAAVIRQTVAALRKQNVDLSVVLYQGNAKEAKSCAEFWASLRQKDAALPPLHVVLCLTDEEEPSGIPEKAGQTQVVSIGHRGRYVGVFGVFRPQAAADFTLKYQLAAMGPDYETPAGQESSNAVLPLMEEYSSEVKRRNLLAKYPRSPHPVQLAYPEAKYVGSERCSGCHDHAYEVWDKSAHAHAFDSLVKARNPSLRQFDGECVACHVTGFQYQAGYYDSGNHEKHNQKLVHVGCEACHGPGSVHVKNTRDAKLHALMNPYKATPEELDPKTDPTRLKILRTRRHNAIDQFCQKCHDHDNDVHWTFDKWTKKNIVHMTPPKKAK